MGIENMPSVSGIDRQEVEFALDTLLRAAVIQDNPKMMGAIGQVARDRANNLARFSPNDVPKLQHPDRARDGKVNF